MARSPEEMFAALQPQALEVIAEEAYHRRRPRDLPDVISIRQPRPRRRSLLLLAPAAALGATAVVVGLSTYTKRRGGPTESNGDGLDARQTLQLVADRAGNAGTLVVAQGKFVYTKARETQLGKAPVPGGTAFFLHDVQEEHWASTDGLLPVRFTITSGIDARPLTPAEATKLAKSSYPWTEQRTVRYPGDAQLPPSFPPTVADPSEQPGPYWPTPAYLASLPTDPQRLLAAIRSGLPPGKPGLPASVEASTLFSIISRLVTRADVLLTQQLRAAFYLALSTLPGIERLPGRVSIAGREGIALGHTENGERAELILDPDSSRALGTRRITVRERRIGDSTVIPPGTVTAMRYLEEQKVVDSAK